MTTITIRKASGTFAVRAGGAVLGESTQVLEIEEDGHAPVLYFPRSDIAMAFMDRSETQTHCPHKGDATHFSIVTKSTVLKDAAWSYENPLDGVAEIRDYVAFYERDEVAVEQI